jgi:DNA-binding LacI/PurR family transcriptional regulator
MLILLDIDGVMVQAASWKPVEILDDGFTSFSARAVSGLQRIISETNASIVLTTSHKSKYNLAQWQEIFKKRGITATINKLDDNKNYLTRKEEIINWANDNKHSNQFVIIDDDKSLNGLPNNLKEKLIQTSAMIGLNDEDTSNAITILKSYDAVIAL